MLIQQARDLHVRIHFVCIDIHRECMQGTFVYVCVASLFSVLLINCQRSQISRSDQGRSDNGVYACANAYLLASEASLPSRTNGTIFLYVYNWRAKRAYLVVRMARFFYIYNISNFRAHGLRGYPVFADNL